MPTSVTAPASVRTTTSGTAISTAEIKFRIAAMFDREDTGPEARSGTRPAQ
ncbi:hypothetical protein [Rhodococcus tukisamuensis]|uniref:Uncharacterized protein n=1 Tax=Rhodococcus tukisamuensis TaxID=168276 RepID=A0A1G7EGK9_9NOCA|nr:hypothetical protein [Rhodococcus tukisamuensis]SDE62606.1 hypothetical protein SAMN05444580_1247 [Rhodococcus tukisamuensis]